MRSIEEVLNEADGNGLDQKEIIELLILLSQFAIMREDIKSYLDRVYSEKKIMDILGDLSLPSEDKRVMAKLMGRTFTKKQAEIYMMHTIETKGSNTIAAELGISRSVVQSQLDRARSKVKGLEIKKLEPITPEGWKRIIDSSPLTPTQRKYCLRYFVDGVSQPKIGKENGHRSKAVNTVIEMSKWKFNLKALDDTV